MKDIEYHSTDDLVKELIKRFDDFAFIASTKRTKKEDDLFICFGGCYYSVIGLLEVAKMAAVKGEGLQDDDSTY